MSFSGFTGFFVGLSVALSVGHAVNKISGVRQQISDAEVTRMG